jgi:SpoVK/Ycf46/Vps4 family AAA+-type ATPase
MIKHADLENNLEEKQTDSLGCLAAELKRVKLLLVSSAKRLGLDDGDVKSFGHLDVGDTSVMVDITSHSISQLKCETFPDEKEKEPSEKCSRLQDLRRLFNLSPFDIDVLLIGLLPKMDSRFGKYYAYIQDDMTRRNLSVDLILKLLCRNFDDRLKAKQSFNSGSPLVINNLICLSDSPGQNSPELLQKLVRTDERISDYLTGMDKADDRLHGFTNIYSSLARLKDISMNQEMKARLALFVQNKTLPAVFNFYGPAGTGKQTTSEAVCSELQMPLLYVNSHRIASSELSLQHLIQLVFREGKLQHSAIYIDMVDSFARGENTDTNRVIFDFLQFELESYPYPVFLSSEKRLEFTHFPENKRLATIEFALPDYSSRKQLWQRQFNDMKSVAGDVDFSSLANKFRFNGDQIAGAASAARSLAFWRDPENGIITGKDLNLACRQRSRNGLSTLAHQVGSRYNWDDIILPKDQKAQLMEVCSHVKYLNTVYEDWGFGQKHTQGRGINILFTGPSGTGKTMAAEIIGNELSMDVYKIDLSTIVSKYIGETEKNLENIFKEVTAANAIVFFDEADSIFGKRSEVRDSHDRYANIEISYLLQKLDDYDGLIILATNLRKNMDDAFTRRMHFCIEFPLPEEADRYRIWQHIFPEKAPLGQDIDFVFLARQFVLTGGNIRNIALTAAFLAAQGGEQITMNNLIRAIKREYQKTGRLCTEGDFGQYFNLVKNDDV